jgi:hypothetical protein
MVQADCEKLDRRRSVYASPAQARDGRGPAPPPDQPGKAFRIKGIIRQPGQSFAFHLAATPAGDPAHEHLQIDAVLTTRQGSDQTKLLIVKTAVPKPTNPTGCFF